MNRLLSFSRASIKRKQVLIIMLNTTAALLLAFAGFTAYEVVTFRAAMVRSLSTLARITGNNVAGTLDFNDPKSAAEDLFALRDDPHIIGACVYGADGAPFATYGPGFKPPPRVPDSGHAFSDGNLSFTCPVKSRGDVVGALYLVSDCQALYARLGEYAQIAGAVFVLTLIVALVLSSRLQRLMCQPILQLARAARLAGQNKDYGVRVIARNPDEIGALVESFNDMLAQIQERDSHLEQRVAERTRELEREIAERKQTEVKLDYERGLLRSLMEHSSDCIYFKDRESRFISCSKAMCDRFGTTSEGIIGKTDFDLFDSTHAREAFEDEQRILQTSLPIHGKVEHEISTDGTETWALTSKMPLRDKAGNITGTFGISKDITAMKVAEASLEKVHSQLVVASRQAGMAEVATSVLHNVGNVLNSITVSTTLVLDALAASKVKNLGRLASLLAEHKDHLPDFFASDPKAREILPYLQCLADTFAKEQENLTTEMRLTRKNIEHIKDIVAMQQNYASYAGVVEKVSPVELVEDALRMNDAALARHQVRVIRRFDPHLSEITADKHKILQILVNLVRNAKYACDECDRPDKTITIELNNGGQHVRFAIADNGIGIPPENLNRIFNHGFTTRKNGHGFGLHSGALAAREMGGSLTAHSDGPGAGACFTLDLPLHPPPKS
jgi:PAS domain S-box-containing protein